MDLGAMLHQSADRFGDDLAVAVESPEGMTQHSFRSLDRASNRVANGLLEAGISRGDPVALLVPNSLAFVETLCACLKIGAPVTPINVRFDAADVAYVLDDADPAVLVAHPDLLEPLESADALSGRALTVFTTDAGDGHRHYDDLRAAPADAPAVSVGEDAVDGYFYTSGSTGRPKGVVHHHRDRLYANTNLIAEFGLRHDDVHCTPLPMFHSGPLYTGLVPFLQFGVATVLLDGFDPARTVTAIQDWEATILGGVPAQYRSITEEVRDRDARVDSLRFWWISGAPLTDALRADCETTLCEPHSIVYGATEIGPPVSTLQPTESEHHPTSCGTGHMGQRIRIVDATGEPDPTDEVDVGETGELIVSGESVMDRYLNRPAETEAAFVGEWYCTGDIGWRDEDGYLYVEGRKDNMIISGGENIYPSEIETVLETHPAIEDVVVLGVDHDRWGETPKAFVVTAAERTLTEAAVDEFCRDSDLADYKRPRIVTFVDEIPRNPSGGSVLTEELQAKD